MAATAYYCISSTTNLPSLSSTVPVKTPNRICSIPCPNFFRPNLGSLKSYRLNISHNQRKTSNNVFGVLVVSCLVDDNSKANAESSQSSVSNGSSPEVTIDIKLPRRSLLVQFTCDACGERSQKLINRLAYDKGTVFVQCSGCSQYHKLVDNLHLVVEYNFREGVDVDSNADQV